MPQLPSGQHVSISLDRALTGAGNGNFAVALMVEPGTTTVDDIGDLIDILYYRARSAPPTEANPGAGEPYLSGLCLSDITTEKCKWPAADKSAFHAWLQQPRTRAWLQEQFEELVRLVETVPVDEPEGLRGMF